jgi:hypothetical protein
MIPSILTTALATTLGSALAGRLMVFQPFLLIAGITGALGCGLMLTFDLNPHLGAIIGFQILFGVGVGLGVQLPNLVATVTSSPDNVALTISSVACKHPPPPPLFHSFIPFLLYSCFPDRNPCFNVTIS